MIAIDDIVSQQTCRWAYRHDYLCSYCGTWVMLQIVLKRNIFIKRSLSHQLPYIKLLVKLHALYYTDVQNIQQNNRLNHYTKRRKSIFSGWTTIGGMFRLKTQSYWIWCHVLFQFKESRDKNSETHDSNRVLNNT